MRYYRWGFTVPNINIVNYMINNDLKNVVPDAKYNPKNDRIEGRPNNSFSTYSKESRNCFVATASWLAWMGINDLNTVLNAADYMRYSPKVLYRYLGNNWNKAAI
ncbi:MAG: hypothetical protein Q4E13_08985 [Clostridia bacterium]|nr:hypothetical protein [Clostridia bacterium]